MLIFQGISIGSDPLCLHRWQTIVLKKNNKKKAVGSLPVSMLLFFLTRDLCGFGSLCSLLQAARRVKNTGCS